MTPADLEQHACLGYTSRITPRHRTNNGRLQRLLSGYQPSRSAIAAVYPSRRHLSAKVRTFVGFLAARFAQEQAWALPRVDETV